MLTPMAARIVTIGNFDGVHVGHAALVARARSEADALGGGPVVAMAFDPHPASVLRPGREPARLTSFERRAELLRELGADEVVRLEPTRALLENDPEAFLRWLMERSPPTAVVEGDDFRFGRGRAGDSATLQALGQRFGFDVHIVEPVEVALTDQTIVRASSTATRWLIAHGRVRDASVMLGRWYELKGVVVQGDRRGRELGFPTANIETGQLLPADGVYAGEAELDDGSVYVAAVSVGTKPMFGGRERTLEAHLLDAPQTPDGRIEGLDEYGWVVRVRLMGWVRDQTKFGSVAELVSQIGRDCERTARIVESCGGRAAIAGWAMEGASR